jgi:membrane protein implicated in regulation of membrane protease activity
MYWENSVVEEKIDNISASGMVKIDGVEWTARSEDGSVIEKGTRVRIVKIEGVKVFVIKDEDKENK